MTHVRLVLEYDGARFSGWQRQPGQRTVQAEVEAALAALNNGAPLRLDAAGRTDAGVHARGQVACFRWDGRIAPAKLVAALNARLPEDVAVLRADEAADDFDPRHHTWGKSYRYRIMTRFARPVLERGRVWRWSGALDAAAMRAAAAHFVGEHDFSAFRASDCMAAHSVRRVYACEVEAEDEGLAVRVYATAFLKHMVRNIVGTLMDVGRGRLRPDDVPAIIASRDRSRCGPTAPAHGLELEAVYYADHPPPERWLRLVPVEQRRGA